MSELIAFDNGVAILSDGSTYKFEHIHAGEYGWRKCKSLPIEKRDNKPKVTKPNTDFDKPISMSRII